MHTQVPLERLDVVDDATEQARYTRWLTSVQGQRLGESALQLSGLVCAACAGIIEQALLAVPGVHSAQVAAASQRASVRWDPAQTRPSAFIAAISAAGYGAVPDAAAPARLLRRAESRQALWRLFVAGFCAMQIMMLATPSYVAGPGELAGDIRQLLNWGSWLLCLPIMAFSATPFFTRAWRGLRAGRIGMDVPVALALLIAFVAGTGATFAPQGVFGHEVYFDSLGMFVSFLLGARFLEMRARHHAAETLEATLDQLPEAAWRVAADGRLETVSVHALRPGDEVRVPVGQAFPADGTLLRGSTQADESLLSGESSPVPKSAGAALVAGSINVAAPVHMRVLRVGADTRLQAIVSMMRSAMTQRPAAAALADRWAGPFLVAVLLLAAAAALAWSVIDPSRAVSVAVAVLIVTCPCALSLAAPAALVAAARGLAGEGVLLQRLDALEMLARVTQVYFDKTGTLTHLQCAPGQGSHSPETWAQAASLAAWSSHPVSRALAAMAPPAATVWADVQEIPGQGVQATDEAGRQWRLGSASFVGAPESSGAAVWLGCSGQGLAAFELADLPRPGARAAVQALQAMGLQVSLLSGDAPQRAVALASALGLDGCVGGATPEDKLAVVCAAQARGERVLMVGDGINDAPVLARADVSLAMGQAALVARTSADAVVMSNQLTDIVRARARAERTMRIVRQNLGWAVAYNALCIPLALLGWLPPWAAGLGMAGSSLAVVLNALRAAR